MPWMRSSASKVQTNVFCCCLIVNYGVALHRTCYTIVCIFGPGIFLGLDFWLHWIIPVIWNPVYPPWDLQYFIARRVKWIKVDSLPEIISSGVQWMGYKYVVLIIKSQMKLDVPNIKTKRQDQCVLIWTR